jgi:Flp pilus assembly protein TadD/TolB-like protein
MTTAAPAQPASGAKLLVVLPFENVSNVPGIEWIGEAFPEVLGERLSSGAPVYVVGRDERLYALDRLGIPAHSRPSRATLYRIAEEMDVTYVVMGKYDFDGSTFTVTAQLLDMRRLQMSPEIKEGGPLVKLIDLQTALAWELLRVLDPQVVIARNRFVAAAAPVRLDALENFIRGVITTDNQERIRYLRNAVRIDPQYTQALLELGKSYFEEQDYENAAVWLARVPKDEPKAAEANFYLGLAGFYRGDYAGAERAFELVVSRLPLPEVLNNLGVVASRRGKQTAADHFRKAAQIDPKDPDYRFNLGVALYRIGDNAAAARELREALALKPADAEARSFLNTMTSPPASVPVSRAAPPAAARGAANPATAAPAAAAIPLERIKRNYDENSFRQLALEIHNVLEERLEGTDRAEHAAFHVERGGSLLSQGLPVEAEREFREAIILNPTDAGAHVGLAQVLERNGQPEQARNEANASVRLRQNAAAFVVLARLDLRENKTDAAAENVRRALALEPDNADARALERQLAAAARP